MATIAPAAYDSKVEGNVIFSRLDVCINWMRKNSLWPMPMGLACCAIELMAAGASRFDIARFGAEVMRFSPRQSDVMIVAGTVTYKMALAVKRIYDQMPEPKWVIAMGACASSGGMYRSYAVLQGIDRLLTVAVYIRGCPPRPEALLAGMLTLPRQLELAWGQIEQACKFAKEQLGFNFLMDLSSVDNFGDEPRFEVVYELYSMDSNIHLRLKTRVSEDHPELPSVVHRGATANWHEREVYDMMGIRFSGHPDLRRILMWEGYPYFPLRKEFPLEGLPSNMPDVAFSETAPLEGGPFVTLPSTATAKDREPRARRPIEPPRD